MPCRFLYPCTRRYYKRVQYADLIVSRFIFPLAVLVHVYLNIVYHRRAEQPSSVLHYIKVATLKSCLGGRTDGINASYPACSLLSFSSAV